MCVTSTAFPFLNAVLFLSFNPSQKLTLIDSTASPKAYLECVFGRMFLFAHHGVFSPYIDQAVKRRSNIASAVIN